MIEMENTHHHVEMIDLPTLKPLELYGLYRLTRYLEPYTNRLVMTCEIQTVNADKILRREIKAVRMRSSDIPAIMGFSTVTANKIMKVLREKNVVKKEKAYYVNPKHVRVHNTLSTGNTAAMFEETSAAVESVEVPKLAESAESVEGTIEEDEID